MLSTDLLSSGYLVCLPLRHLYSHNTLTSTLPEGNGCPCLPHPSLCLDQKTGSVQKWWQSCLLMHTDRTIRHLLTLALFTPLECALKKGLQPHHLPERHWSRRKPTRRYANSMTGSSTVVKPKVRRKTKMTRLEKRGMMRAPPDLHLLQLQVRDLEWPLRPPLHSLHPLPLVAQPLSLLTTGRRPRHLVPQP